MAEKRTREIKLTEWFPRNDALATQIARLCVLKEYYMLEMRGLTSDDLRELDSHSDAWRRLYFLFNSVRTLWEIQGAITVICGNAEFKRIRASRGAKEDAELTKLVSKLNAAIPSLRAVRDSLGGHISQQALQTALNAMDSSRTGELEIGETVADTHYKFSRQLVHEVMLTGIPAEQRPGEYKKYIEMLSGLLPVIESLETIVIWYAQHRGLVPRS
jgi:hypothetical protein